MRETRRLWKTDTICVHGGEAMDTDTRALRRPIHMANSYALPTDLEDLLATLSWDNLDKWQYTREHSPTPRALEERLAWLEGGEDCVVTASGMGAVAAVLFSLLSAGDHVVASEICYTGTQKLLSEHLPRWGLQASMVDTTDRDAVAAAMRDGTRMVYIETPGNPIVSISDIAELAAIAHQHGALLVVDSTWSGLVGQKPLALGADLVIHSTTKYINGHGDALGGAVIGPKAVLARVRENGIVHLGACISPFNAWLIQRGSVTLPLRMEKHTQNALRVAGFLESHEKVDMVRYPGLPSHPQHELARRQMTQFSGMLNFRLKADMMAHFAYISDLRTFAHAVSLGHDQSLIMYLPTAFFFTDMVVMNPAQQERYTRIMGEGIFRVSIGIEDPEDLIADLSQALERVPAASATPTGE